MNYYEEIKNELIDNEFINVNIETDKYGDGLIREYFKKLTLELGKGYTFTALSRMRKYYIIFSNVATLSQLLSRSHYVEILTLKDINEIQYYINISINSNLGVRELRERIKNHEYERLDNKTKNKLINNEKTIVSDFVKNPIVIKNSLNKEIITEKYLKKLILEDLSSFMKELGLGFSYIDNEYKITIGNTCNYIDILLFNIKYNCYVVVELKVVELKKEHIGQIMLYMNYIDKNIKSINQDKTIGIIVCKKDNKLILEYCSDTRIFSSEFILV